MDRLRFIFVVCVLFGAFIVPTGAAHADEMPETFLYVPVDGKSRAELCEQARQMNILDGSVQRCVRHIRNYHSPSQAELVGLPVRPDALPATTSVQPVAEATSVPANQASENARLTARVGALEGELAEAKNNDLLGLGVAIVLAALLGGAMTYMGMEHFRHRPRTDDPDDDVHLTPPPTDAAPQSLVQEAPPPENLDADAVNADENQAAGTGDADEDNSNAGSQHVANAGDASDNSSETGDGSDPRST